MGVPEKVDLSLIPSIHGPNDREWALVASTLDIEAAASLICDNLLDLSHAPYVHGNSFGAGDPKALKTLIAGESTTQVTKLPRGVHIERWHVGRPSNPYTGPMMSDDYVVNDFIAPGIFTLKTTSYKPGILDRCNGHAPNETPLLARYTCQMITPVTEKKSKFFFAFGPWANASESKQQFFNVANTAFQEDKAIIELQQAMINRSAGRPMMALGMDVPLARFQSVLKHLLEEDQQILESA